MNLSVVDDDLEIEDGAKITCSGDGSLLVVNGEIECRGDADFAGSVRCDDFEGRDGRINITGSLQCGDLTIDSHAELWVGADIHADDVEVDKELRVGGTIEADSIEVGGRFETNNVHADSVSVGGIFDARGDVEVEDVEVGGKLEIGGKINSKDLSVGGKATLHGGGKVSEGIEVGGVLSVDAPIEYGNIEVGGTARLKGTSRGRDIEIGGTFEVEGDLVFEEMEVGGYAKIKGSANGQSIDLGGRMSIDNGLKLRGSLDIGGTIEVGDIAEVGDAEIGGRFRARQLRVRDLELGGGARTEEGIFAEGTVRINHRSQVEGWIRALRNILVESRSEVESISAPTIRVEDHARVKNIYADQIELEDRVEVSGEILYTSSIKMGDDPRISNAPQKVSVIPSDKSWTQISNAVA